MIDRFEEKKNNDCKSLPFIIIGCMITYTFVVYIFPSAYINYP